MKKILIYQPNISLFMDKEKVDKLGSSVSVDKPQNLNIALSLRAITVLTNVHLNSDKVCNLPVIVSEF